MSSFTDEAHQQKAMMTLYDSQSSSESQAIRTPVAANKALLGQPTSANVHLYADPITIHTDNPFLFADCEGLNGGNDSPAAVVVQEEIARQSGRLGGQVTYFLNVLDLD